MDILLVQAPVASIQFPPLGLAYLKSFLQKKHTVTILDLNALYYHYQPEIWEKLGKINFYGNPSIFRKVISSIFEKISFKDKKLQEFIDYIKILASYSAREILKNYNFNLIGFSILDISLILSLAIAKELKDLYPALPVILGGPTFCNLSSLNIFSGLKNINCWDAVVFGEGENTLLQLADQLEQGKLTGTEGALIKIKNNIIYKKPAKEISIDILPYPDFDDFTFKYYLNPITLPMISSRGCTGKCNFCRERLFWKKYRVRNPADVILEIEETINKYGFRSFIFCDSLINGNREWLEKFSRLIIKKNIHITWEANARISSELDKKLLRLMKNAGCWRLKYGVESGSDYLLKKTNKNIKLNTTEKVIKKTKEENIKVHIYMILNFPGETYNDSLENCKFLLKNINYIDGVTFHSYINFIEKSGISWSNQNVALKPGLSQLVNLIHLLFTNKAYYKNYFNLLAGIYKKIISFDLLLDLNNGNIIKNNTVKFKNKKIYVNILLNQKSLQKVLKIIKEINPQKIGLSLSWNKTSFFSLKNKVSELKKELKGMDIRIIKPIPPCLYGKRRNNPCRVCFQFINLKGREIEKMIAKYRKKYGKPLPFKEFMKKFCRSRVSSYCRKCKDFKENRCTGVCNNPKQEVELNSYTVEH